MTFLYRLRALVRWLFRRDEIERALDSDLQDYIERSAAEKMRAGMTEAEATRAARIELGGVEQTKDRVRATLSFGPVETFVADAGYALRTLGRQKTFTVVAVATLALGVGVNVGIFSLTDQILLRPLPVSQPDRLVNLTDPDTEPKSAGRMNPLLSPRMATSDAGGDEAIFSYPMFRDLERAQEPFTQLAAHRFIEETLSVGGRAARATVAFVSGSYFPVLGFQPALGRLLGTDDDSVDEIATTVVLSHSYWQTEFGGDPDVLGRTLLVNEIPLNIVGVAPPGFHGTAVGARASVFVPITISFSSNAENDPYDGAMSFPNHGSRDFYWVHLFARLKPGFTRASAEAAMNPLYRAILSDRDGPLLVDADQQQREAFRTRTLVLEPGARGQTNSEILSPARNRLELLFAAGVLVLLLCCANVAGLVLVRATTRSGEMAVRTSMGATRARLVMLQLAESVVLALPAAILSLPVAWLTLRGASRVPGMPASAPDMSLSVAAGLVAIGVAVGTALVAGLIPLQGLFRTEPAKTLQADGVRHTTAKGVAGFRATLTTAQIALSMALLATMGVFAQSLANIGRIDLGVDIDPIVMFQLSPRADGSLSGNSSLVEALEAIPGVSSVASSGSPLLALDTIRMDVPVDGFEAEVRAVPQTPVSGGFFEVFGIDVLAGHVFDDAGFAFGEVIVNQRFVENLGLAPEAALGRRIRAGSGPGLEIVGVVADVRSFKVTNEIEPQMYFHLTGGPTFYVRSALPAEDLLSAISDTAARVEPIRPITNLRTMKQQFRENIAMERFIAGTSTVFALLATGLAALGLYGVLAYSVAQRSREIGLRFALGAPTARVRGMVLRQVVRMVLVGIALGATAAAFFGRTAQSLLFSIEAGDPLMLLAAAVFLTAVALGAAYVPARRASRVDPMTVLRYE